MNSFRKKSFRFWFRLISKFFGMKNNKSIKAAIFLILFLEIPFNVLFSFGEKGPYLHSTITTEALARMSQKKSYELDFTCSYQLWYMSGENDYNPTFAKDKTYHCDNNDLMGCSWRLNQLLEKAYTATNKMQALRYTGLALHIVQDFYSHSNWVEIHNFSYLLAEIESFSKIPPPSYIQTGYFPDLFLENPQAQVDCYFKDMSAIKSYIHGGTHDCLNKDSNFTKRGMLFAENSAMTLHELAAEYSIRHSVKVIEKVFNKNHTLKLCYRPKVSGVGCNTMLLRNLESTQN